MIQVTKQPDPEPPFERCCFCRVPTKFWYTPKDVACCRTCAAREDAADVPSKKLWFRREALVTKRY